jgi:hypothetical protein
LGSRFFPLPWGDALLDCYRAMRGRYDPLDVSDIEGTASKKPFERRTAHPFNSNAGIDGSSPGIRGESVRQRIPSY